MKRLLLLIAAITAASSINAYAAEGDISVTLNGEGIALRQAPVIENGRTLVPVREVCEAMNLTVNWNPENKEILVSNSEKYVKLEIGYHTIDINGNLEYLDAAPALINSITCMPIRAVIEPFGAMVDWDKDTRTVVVRVDNDILPDTNTETDVTDNQTQGNTESTDTDNDTTPDSTNTPSGSGGSSGFVPEYEDTTVPDYPFWDYEPEPTPEPTPPPPPAPNPDSFAFYAQQDEEWAFESNGRGYCWACSYAMLMTNITDLHITPLYVAAYNLEMGSDQGAYMANHLGLAERFGLQFVPAIDENSPYFDHFDAINRGATYFKFETEEDVKNALIEALSRNPDGIMVRFEGYPHTMIATEYKNGQIYFNDPGSRYMEDVPFEKTCLASRFTLTDLTFVQAMAKY